jgi:hypothetical protein
VINEMYMGQATLEFGLFLSCVLVTSGLDSRVAHTSPGEDRTTPCQHRWLSPVCDMYTQKEVIAYRQTTRKAKTRSVFLGIAYLNM